MKIRSAAIAAALAICGGLVGYAGSVHADPPKITAAAPALARRAAPSPLAHAKQVARIAEAAKLAHLTAPSSPPQMLDMRLTPIAPRLPNGAEITAAGPLHFNGVGPGEPDGSYILVHGFLTRVSLRAPTETGKLYILDCRMHGIGTTPLKVVIVRSGATGAPTLTADDGHVMHVFQATSPSTELQIAPVPISGKKVGDAIGYFYGCDIGKAS